MSRKSKIIQKIEKENRSLKYEIELKDNEIANNIARKVTIPEGNRY